LGVHHTHPNNATCHQIFPHGSTDALPYATMGSGSLNAMAVFEAGYKDDMSREEAMALAARAIRRWGGGDRQ
jgi:20S proteasome subunit beta 2